MAKIVPDLCFFLNTAVLVISAWSHVNLYWPKKYVAGVRDDALSESALKMVIAPRNPGVQASDFERFPTENDTFWILHEMVQKSAYDVNFWRRIRFWGCLNTKSAKWCHAEWFCSLDLVLSDAQNLVFSYHACPTPYKNMSKNVSRVPKIEIWFDHRVSRAKVPQGHHLWCDSIICWWNTGNTPGYGCGILDILFKSQVVLDR